MTDKEFLEFANTLEMLKMLGLNTMVFKESEKEKLYNVFNERYDITDDYVTGFMGIYFVYV